MVVCRNCNVDVEGKFCGECGSAIEEAPQQPQEQTTLVSYCDACDAPRDAGKFCGECGGPITEKEVAVKRQAGSGLSLFEQNALNSQKSASNPISKTYSGKSSGYCGTFGDDQRRKAQQDASTTGGYNKFGGGASSGYCGTFGDDQRKKAQQAASNPVKTVYGGGGSGYVGSFGDEQRKKAQQNMTTTGGYNKFGGQKPVGGGIDMVTAANLEKQKMISESSRAKDSIVMSTEKKSEDALDFVTANQMKQQKEASAALRSKDKIVQSEEKLASEGTIDFATAQALQQQKETSAALKRQDNLVKTSEGTGEAPKVGKQEEAEEEYRCESCNEVRPKGKFCQECGTPLTVA